MEMLRVDVQEFAASRPDGVPTHRELRWIPPSREFDLMTFTVYAFLRVGL
ncbi:MAG TPA: hypothetical protein VF815_30945 [Myxococcaceae bacterium]|jgi:hypothetical protein